MNVNFDNTINLFLYVPVEIKYKIISYFLDEDLIFRISCICKEFLMIAEVEFHAKLMPLLEKEMRQQFVDRFRSWRGAHVNFIQMSKEGFVISPNEIQVTGERRIGQFLNGKLNGQGKILFSYGEEQEGEFWKGKLHGQGKRIYSTGTIEKGTFANGKLNGLGEIFGPSKIIWKGEFKDGEMNGRGKIIFPNGKEFEGEFKNSLLNGQGKKKKKSGKIWEGNFKDGVLDGIGKIIGRFGCRWEGEFKNDLLNGAGKVILPEIVYKGEFRNHILIKGSVQTFNGDRREGEFIYGFLKGKGKKTYHNGRIDEGEFDMNVLHGSGKIIYPNGEIEEGKFLKGQLIQGKITAVDGTQSDYELNT